MCCRPRPVDLVEHRSERRRLPGAGRAGDEHEAALLTRETSDAGRQTELVEVRDPVRDETEGERDRAALTESVHAEAGKLRRRVREIELAARVEGLASERQACSDVLEHGFQLVVSENFERVDGDELAVLAYDGRLPDLEVDIADAEPDGA